MAVGFARWNGVKRQGPALILGSAPCLLDDLAEAIEKRPDATIFAINEATQEIPPHHIISLHYEKMAHFVRYARQAWPDNKWMTHAAVVTERGCQPSQYPDIDYWWPEMWKPAATSVWFGVQIARAMGNNEIILCGAPMNGGDGYYNDTKLDRERFGVQTDKHAYVKSVQETIAMLAADEADDVRSMSGFTREQFGAPNWQ